MSKEKEPETTGGAITTTTTTTTMPPLSTGTIKPENILDPSSATPKQPPKKRLSHRLKLARLTIRSKTIILLSTLVAIAG